MDNFEKLQGVIDTKKKDKQVYKINYSLVSNLKNPILFTDLKMQTGKQGTEYDKPVSEMFVDEKDAEICYNFLARGNATMIVPYQSEIAYSSKGATLPEMTGYITTPLKVDLFIHKKFNPDEESLSIGSGVTGMGKRLELMQEVESFSRCISNGYTSQQLVNDSEVFDVFRGPCMRLANADNKFTILQNPERKTTGVLYARKTKKGDAL